MTLTLLDNQLSVLSSLGKWKLGTSAVRDIRRGYFMFGCTVWLHKNPRVAIRHVASSPMDAVRGCIAKAQTRRGGAQGARRPNKPMGMRLVK